MMCLRKAKQTFKTMSDKAKILIVDDEPLIRDALAFKLTKDEAKKTLEDLMAEGVNPDDLRAIPD